MKKYFLLAAAAATVLAVSCNKEKEQPKVDPTPGTEIEDNTPQPIRFGTQIAEVKSPITKSAIENTGWDGEDLYIYGLEFDGTNVIQSNVGTEAAPEYDIYIKQVKATAPQSDDDLDNLQRDPINVYQPNTTKYYYYKGTNVYNFYGYYVGGAKVAGENAAGTATETIGENHVVTSIAIPNLEIAGTDDIMIATTDKFEDYLYAQGLLGANVTVSPDKIYSATSARQGVVPDLVFKHLLSRFVFETAYGGTHNDDYNDNRAKVKINSLKLKSPFKGTFTILGENPGFDAPVATENDEKFFELEGLDDPVSPGKDYAAGTVGYGEFAPLGSIEPTSAANGSKVRTASILAVPKTGTATAPAKYELVLNVSQYDGPGANASELENQDVKLEVDLSKLDNPTYSAEAGKQYRVKIIVYGLEEIKLTVSLEKWGEVGETIIDPDQDPRPATTITVKDKENNADLTAINPLLIGDANAYDHINATAQYGTTPTDIAPTSILFASSNKKVATVDNTGKVTGVSAGTCKIYVYVNGNDDYQGALKAVTVTVSAAAPLSPNSLAVVADAGEITLNEGAGVSTSAVITTAGEGALTIEHATDGTSETEYKAYFSINNENKLVVAKVGDNVIPSNSYTITVKAAGDDTHASVEKQITVTIQ